MSMTAEDLNKLRAWVGERVDWTTERRDLVQFAPVGSVASGAVVDVGPWDTLLVRPDGPLYDSPNRWVFVAADRLRKRPVMTGVCPACGYEADHP